jgi:NAD(P)-dependent dehydrogenase (short-subunit alcohol dehydrogenase family)
LRAVEAFGHLSVAAGAFRGIEMVDISRRDAISAPEALHPGQVNGVAIPARVGLPERTILITGCSSGIGYASARALKAHGGWRIFATCRRQEDCDRLEREGFESLPIDLSSSASIAAGVDEILRRTGGRLDALFNNGAYSHPGAIEDVPTDYVRRLFETNFFGWYEITQRILPVMRKQGHGRIINCSSVLGFVSVRFMGVYAASKHAVEGWNDALRLELDGTGIEVSILQPGPIRSRMLDNARARFIETIDLRNSKFRSDYGRVLSRLATGNRANSFKLGPEAVAGKLIHALESPRPRARYQVTIPTMVGAWLKRLLPTRVMDRVLLKQR